MVDFAEAKEDVLREFLTLPGGPPSHDTFSHIFRLLDPGQFHAAFQRFLAAYGAAPAKVVAIGNEDDRKASVPQPIVGRHLEWRDHNLVRSAAGSAQHSHRAAGGRFNSVRRRHRFTNHAA